MMTVPRHTSEALNRAVSGRNDRTAAERLLDRMTHPVPSIEGRRVSME